MKSKKMLWCAASLTLGILATGAVATASSPNLSVSTSAPAFTFRQLASFNGENGEAPLAGVALDAAGDLFGTTAQEGTGGEGTLYEIAAGSGQIKTLINFNSSTGNSSHAFLLSDASGNLTGTTLSGGTNGTGTIFQLSTGSMTLMPLINFAATGAGRPSGTPAVDSAGNLYDVGNNTLFEVGATNHSASTLATFTGLYGPSPYAGPVFDKYGNLYGTAQLGGNSGLNSYLWRYSPSTKTLTRLANFSVTGVIAPVTFDSTGNLFVPAGGSILEIPAAQTLSTTTVTPTTVYTFTGGADGAGPNGPLVIDASGNIFGTASGGGINSIGQMADGTVFELTAGTSRTINTLCTFTGDPNGDTPDAGLTMDASGDLFGTTSGGGPDFDGTVFELSPVTVPEPASASLLAIGVGGLALLRRRGLMLLKTTSDKTNP
jgi:uncharacterized repeat protein (TIGR03803 family)